MSQTILIVDDFADVRAFLRYFLEQLGYRVIEAADGENVLTLVKENKFDLILMNITLPGENGLIVTSKIRASLSKEELPIIATTGYGAIILQDALDAGCNELLSKPFSVEQLESIVKKYLG